MDRVIAIRRQIEVLGRLLKDWEPRKPTVIAKPKDIKRLRMQGRYMGYMRQLKPRQKSQVKQVKQREGIGAAIQAAKKMCEERWH